MTASLMGYERQRRGLRALSPTLSLDHFSGSGGPRTILIPKGAPSARESSIVPYNPILDLML